jgi:hypothetical protein
MYCQATFRKVVHCLPQPDYAFAYPQAPAAELYTWQKQI